MLSLTEDKGYILYERVNEGFVRHKRWQRNQKQFHYENVPVLLLGLEILQYVSVKLQQESLYLLNTLSSSTYPKLDYEEDVPFTQASISAYLTKNLPPWACQRARTTAKLNNVKQSMIEGKALLVSDESLFPHFHRAGSAWIILIPDT